MALTLFKNLANEITDFEKQIIVPLLIDALAYKTRGNTLSSGTMSNYLKACGHSTSAARVRKLLSYATIACVKEGKEEHLGDRVIMADGNGYWVTDQPRDIDDLIEDLARRIDNMSSRIDSLKAQKQNLIHKKSIA